MKTAIVHDWLVVYGGAERVLEQVLHLYPRADIYSLIDFLPANSRDFLMHKKVNTSFIQNLPMARTKYRHYLPLMPLAIEQFDLSGYDLVISSSHAVAKGVLTGPGQLHLCICHSPVRYAWDLQHQYLQETGLNKGLKSWYARKLLHDIRLWDCRTANGVDEFIAVSRFVQRRIWKTYRRESAVIYPPVDTDAFTLHKEKEDFYLTASRMVPYKKMDLIVRAFQGMPQSRLVVIGDGPEYNKIKKLCKNNITMLGYQPFEVLKNHMQRARAFVFAAEEDFGIIPVEAQACGTPVIAYAGGGALETVRGFNESRPTGHFFAEQTEEAIRRAVAEFEKEESLIKPETCRENALNYSCERFRRQFSSFIKKR